MKRRGKAELEKAEGARTLKSLKRRAGEKEKGDGGGGGNSMEHPVQPGRFCHKGAGWNGITWKKCNGIFRGKRE